MRVLLVDDEESILVPLEFLLKKGGHEVVLARTGEEALRALEEGGFALVVLDLMLPGLDGFAVLEALREKPSRPKVLVLTARGREADRAKAMALGAEAFMTKPFSTRALMEEVRRLLGEG
ncbi:response regulator [Thermus sp.]|uniref:response regulator transcription factor n=1 Tax=Thermus sp. TaxID=275 RepID=UPI00307CD461